MCYVYLMSTVHLHVFTCVFRFHISGPTERVMLKIHGRPITMRFSFQTQIIEVKIKIGVENVVLEHILKAFAKV